MAASEKVHEKVDISGLIGNGPFTALQLTTVLLCGFSVLMDGFDVQMIGYVAPAIVQDWKVDKAEFGSVFVAGMAGLLIGSLLLSMLADRIGRRPVLIASTFFFAVCMILTAQAGSMRELMILRFVTSLGLGCILPNAMALVGEYTPARRRVSILTIVSVGFTAGAVLAGFTAAALIPRWGWQSAFYVGGALPLIAGLLMLRNL